MQTVLTTFSDNINGCNILVSLVPAGRLHSFLVDSPFTCLLAAVRSVVFSYSSSLSPSLKPDYCMGS
ncbi:hypothetical protein L2E82_29619 [Cichorium intybus]|uniref:Uncharacterized protein n=1 Tax=Cichorium intybus TaxID=13427 RepID=A0ACB9CYF6_CICIN|nr:hypothetical protein L2E82_29619 [Cichorium intybus]